MTAGRKIMGCRELIEAAFAEVPYPGDDNIALHENCLECDDLRAYLRGKSWRDLKFPELRSFHESLPLLTPVAFRYFLPGYMLASLSDFEHADMIPYSIIRLGGYATDTDAVKDQAREERKRFNRRQREAIAAWLRELGRSGPGELRGSSDIDYAIRKILED